MQTAEQEFDEHVINKYGCTAKDLSEVSKTIFDKELEIFWYDKRAQNEEWKDE